MGSPLKEPKTACVPNIGPRERRRRAIFGVAAFVMSGITIWGMVASGQSRWTRALVALPVFLGFVGVLQASAQTCIALAAQGLSHLDGGIERIDDLARAAVRKQATAVLWKSALATAVVVAVVMALD